MTAPAAINQTSTGEPCVCHACQSRHAVGIGMGKRDDDHRWLCKECVTILERIRSVRRWDPFEERALEGAVAAVGAFLSGLPSYDLSECTEEQARALCKAALVGFGDALRAALEEGTPF